MKIRDDSERSLASLALACYVSERIMHGKWNFCYLVSIITVVWSRNRNMTFIITIKAIITVREISWLTTQHVKISKREYICAKIVHLTVAKKNWA